jgi:hypothetical protein
MGAWGPGNFENDHSHDWASHVEEHGVPYVRAALQEVAEPTDKGARLTARKGEAALAAAEIVAAALGHGGPELPEEAVRFLSKKPVFGRTDVDLAIAAATRLEQKSDLQELWDEGGREDKWHEIVNELVIRLRQR